MNCYRYKLIHPDGRVNIIDVPIDEEPNADGLNYFLITRLSKLTGHDIVKYGISELNALKFVLLYLGEVWSPLSHTLYGGEE